MIYGASVLNGMLSNFFRLVWSGFHLSVPTYRGDAVVVGRCRFICQALRIAPTVLLFLVTPAPAQQPAADTTAAHARPDAVRLQELLSKDQFPDKTSNLTHRDLTAASLVPSSPADRALPRSLTNPDGKALIFANVQKKTMDQPISSKPQKTKASSGLPGKTLTSTSEATMVEALVVDKGQVNRFPKNSDPATHDGNVMLFVPPPETNLVTSKVRLP